MLETQEFRQDIHQIFNKLQKDQAQQGQASSNEHQKENQKINNLSQPVAQDLPHPIKQYKKIKKQPKNQNNISLQYNQLPTKNKLLPKIRVTDDQLDMLKINKKDTIFHTQKNRRLLTQSERQRLRQQLDRRIKGIEDKSTTQQNNTNNKSNPVFESALQLGIGKNTKEVEQRIANLAINGYYYCHESNQLVRDKETPSKRKLQFITESEKINNNYKKQMENVVRDFDQGDFITNNNKEFDKSKIVGKEVLPNQLKCMNDMRKPSVRGALISKLREKNHIGEDINAILKQNKELRIRNREKNTKFFNKEGGGKRTGDENDQDDDDDDDVDYDPNLDSDQDKSSLEQNQDEDLIDNQTRVNQVEKFKLANKQHKKNITIDDILKMQGEGDIMKQIAQDDKQFNDQQELEQEDNQQQELALGADNGGGYDEQASYFIKNQNKSMSDANDLKQMTSPSQDINNNQIDNIVEKVKQQQNASSENQPLDQSQLSQRSTGQDNNEQKINNQTKIPEEANQQIPMKKKKKHKAKINYFLQDQAQLGSDNEEHDNVCYRDNFGDDQEDDEDDQDEEDLKDLIDNTNAINPNDQNQVKNRMDLYLKNQQRDQELDNQKILDLVMGKKREEQSNRANAQTNRKLDFLIKMETEQYNKEEEARKRAQAQLNEYFQKEMKQIRGEGYDGQDDGQNSDFEKERQNQIQIRKLQLNARMSKIAGNAFRQPIMKGGLIRDLSQFNGNAQFSIKINNNGFNNTRKTQLKVRMPQEPKSFPLKMRQKTLNSLMIQKQKFNRTQNIIQKMRINAGIKQNTQQEKLERAKTHLVFNSNNKGKPFNQADSKRKKNKAYRGNKLLEFKS